MFFGYMNSNWEEEFDVPVGPANNIEPGGPDQGQPTHFYPRRNPFLFTIRVPEGFRDERADLDADDARENAEGVCVAEERLSDRSADDLH